MTLLLTAIGVFGAGLAVGTIYGHEWAANRFGQDVPPPADPNEPDSAPLGFLIGLGMAAASTVLGLALWAT